MRWTAVFRTRDDGTELSGGLFDQPTGASAFGARITQSSGGALTYVRYQQHGDQSDILALATESFPPGLRVIKGEGEDRLPPG